MIRSTFYLLFTLSNCAAYAAHDYESCRDRTYDIYSDNCGRCDPDPFDDCDDNYYRLFREEVALNEDFDDFTGDNIFIEERAFESDLYNTNNDFRTHHHTYQSTNNHAFASAFSDTSQVIPADQVTKIQCTVNQEHTPHQISHPYKGDSADFYIEHSGMYEISWSLIISNTTPDTATVEILANDKTIQPTQTETLDTSGQRTISGTIIIPLKKKTILNLAVLSSTGGLVVNSPMFTVNQM